MAAKDISAIPADLVPAGCEWPIVLGIDPGTQVVGFGAVVVAPGEPRFLACGVIRGGARRPVPERLARIRAELDQLITRVRPRVVVVEQAFSAGNPKSALRIGEGRGVVLATAAERGCEIAEYPPAVAKKAVIGHGGATKAQVRSMVCAILKLAEEPAEDDATDALALALAHTNRLGLLNAIRASRRGS